MSSKNVATAIIDFLNQATATNAVSDEEKESLEVAAQCIKDSFKINPIEIVPGSGKQLVDAYDAYEQQHPVEATSSNASNGKDEAEKYKAQGNEAIAKKEYQSAVDLYTKAIELDPTSPVYYSNRAAAYSQLGQYESSVEDALTSLSIDPKHARAYGRLGRAKLSLGDAAAAADAYAKGLELDPSNDVLKRGLEAAKEQINPSSDVEAQGSTTEQSRDAGAGGMPDLGSLFSGGMPDLGSLMNNPAIMNMAQNMMQSGALNNLMGDPNIANMARNFQSGGGMPDLNSLAGNPQLQNLARNFRNNQNNGNPENNSQ
ncbi:TRC complex (ER membrane insertion) TPR repeat subunit Sgt2 [Schizosaccharomyces osmophilus]|uniref:TRC complex (ER membrane insertion) TPR repeat subunit Sgt2 n=1 Tax=Schizosaccharomyces osmophilus TaxID=2545709 RepID=A0AAF0AV97_9SCHI|nr:TRC complex (ER membrane insertion) TPR repeat subunit Sgt2 [Schizosaccharomyces osmophilus]WBW73351.1 TRC complex (ER membrane insertion) TPR repeat subunit Sgt2 [Schizosaccharomyces osmophilus]